MNHSSLRKWLSNNKYIYPKGTKNYTHLLLSGGIVVLPEDQMDTFFDIYSTDVMNGKKNYIAECRTSIFKFLVDMDLYEKEKVRYSKIKEYITIINEVIYDFYPDSKCKDRKVIICTTDSCEKELNGTTFIKTGVHMVWPKLCVKAETALILRRGIIQKLEQKFGSRHPDNEWSDVLDASVYTSNGLRMIGSSKCYSCKYCKGKAGDLNCEKCFGVGKVDEGRIYMPRDIILGNGKSVKEKYADDFHKVLLESSLRTNLSRESFCMVIPDWFKNVKETKKRILCSRINHENFSKESNKELKVKEFVEKDCEIYKKLSFFIRKNFPMHVKKGMNIVDIHKGKNCYVVRTDSKFCMNIDGEHNSNTIYFYIDRHYVYQRCFCRCEKSKGRKFGLCRDYRSKGIELPSSVRNILYSSAYHDDIGFPKEILGPKVDRLEKLLKQLDDEINQKDIHERKYHIK